MAFFGLTYCGYQDTIYEHVRDTKVTPLNAFRLGLYRDPTFHLPAIGEPRKMSDTEKLAYLVPEGVHAQTATYGSGHRNSYVELQRMKKKYIQNPKGNYYAVLVCMACRDLDTQERSS